MRALQRNNDVADAMIRSLKTLFRSLENESEKASCLKFLHEIFRAENTEVTFLYFCINGAATSLALQYELGLCESAAYRVLKILREMRLIKPALKVAHKTGRRGGPRPTVWALPDASPRQVGDALRQYYRLVAPPGPATLTRSVTA